MFFELSALCPTVGAGAPLEDAASFLLDQVDGTTKRLLEGLGLFGFAQRTGVECLEGAPVIELFGFFEQGVTAFAP